MKEHIKYNPISVALAEKYFSLRTGDVEAYIFMATTGRSGSKSLAKVFEAADNAVTYHEPYPVMFNYFPDLGYIPKVEERREYFRKLFYTKKCINIKRNAIGHRYYVETNHQFIKNFADISIKYFKEKIRIIHVLRNPVSVASSFYSIKSIPDTTHSGKVYAIDPKDENNFIKITDLLYHDEDFKDPFFKCLWYWYELHTRVKRYKEKYPSVKWHTMNTDDMNNREKLIEMFSKLGVAYNPEKLDEVVGTRSNRVPHMKTQAIDYAKANEMHEKLLNKMVERFGENFWL